MAINFWRWVKGNAGTQAAEPVPIEDLCEAYAQYAARDYAFKACVNLVASAVGQCKFKTFRDGTETRGEEHYLWNVEPNQNQNASAFLHKIIWQLFTANEALVIETRRRDGQASLVVADCFEKPEEYPARSNEYRGVAVGQVRYNKTFRENEVLHLKLHHEGVKRTVDALYQSYEKLLGTAMRRYIRANGNHLKVHVDQIARGGENFVETFRAMIEKQVKPFFDGENAVLPEFDGYQYSEFGAGAPSDTTDVRRILEEVLDSTARSFLIPPVLLRGGVESTKDAPKRIFTACVDPICGQLEEEINRKRYGFEQWQRGSYLKIDTSAIGHFDLFENAASVEKLIGSGAYTINEVRAAAGSTELDEAWADAHWMTKNISGIENAANEIGG